MVSVALLITVVTISECVIVYACTGTHPTPDQLNKLNKKCQNQPLYCGCGCMCVHLWKRVNFTQSLFFCAFRANKYCSFFICTENESYERWWFFIHLFFLKFQFLLLLLRFLVLFSGFTILNCCCSVFYYSFFLSLFKWTIMKTKQNSLWFQLKLCLVYM